MSKNKKCFSVCTKDIIEEQLYHRNGNLGNLISEIPFDERKCGEALVKSALINLGYSNVVCDCSSLYALDSDGLETMMMPFLSTIPSNTPLKISSIQNNLIVVKILK